MAAHAQEAPELEPEVFHAIPTQFKELPKSLNEEEDGPKGKGPWLEVAQEAEVNIADILHAHIQVINGASKSKASTRPIARLLLSLLKACYIEVGQLRQKNEAMAENMQKDIQTVCGGVTTGLSALRTLCLDPEEGPDATLATVAGKLGAIMTALQPDKLDSLFRNIAKKHRADLEASGSFSDITTTVTTQEDSSDGEDVGGEAESQLQAPGAVAEQDIRDHKE